MHEKAGTVEGLLAEVAAKTPTDGSFTLWVPDALSMNGEPIEQGTAMAIIVDAILGTGLLPDGFVQGDGGREYRYVTI